MKFEINVYEAETASKEKSFFTRYFSKTYLEPTFLKNNYGPDVENVAIVIIMIKNRPGYEKWYKVRRPRYIEHLASHYVATGEPWEWNKRFVIEIRFDGELFDDFVAADDEKTKCILARESLKALELLEKLPKRLNNFDKERFKKDVAAYYRQKGWI